jgi:hypothetical protein
MHLGGVMITKSRLVIFLMIVILSGCVMLDPYNIYLFSDAETVKGSLKLTHFTAKNGNVKLTHP